MDDDDDDVVSDPLNFEQSDVGVVPNRRIHVSQINDAPHVRVEPGCGAGVGLVFPDQDRVRHREQTDQSPVLQELKDLRLVCQALVNADFFHLRDQDLEQSHDGLERELGFPRQSPL